MEKHSRRRDEIGCMWMFINIFGSNQKRLSMDNNKLGIKTIPVNEKKHLTCSCKSVEKLIEEEMLVKKNIDVSVNVEVCKNLTDESEENFSEVIKRLIAQKEGEIQTCKELLEAFHVLSCQEESFLKTISHEDAQSLGDSKRVVEIEEEEAVVVIPKKKGKIFRRKWRSKERRNKSDQIVVLKPASNSLDVNQNKSKSGRNFSRFLIGLFKRRLQCDVLVNSKSVKHVSDNKRTSESDKDGSEDSKKSMCSLYIAAKKHLSEMVANGDIDVNSADKEVPRILGKILSLPEFSSPTDSPTSHDLVSPLSQTSEKSNDLIDKDSDKQDETLFTIDISVPRDNEKEAEIIDIEEKKRIDLLSDTCCSPTYKQVDEDMLESREEDAEEHSSKTEMLNQAPQSLSSPPASSPVRITECKETAADVPGKLSPVSVLEPLFADDDISPTKSTRLSSGEMRMQPLCIRFDEADSPKQDNANNIKTNMDDKGSTLAYIEAVVNSSGLSWENLLSKTFNSEHLLDPNIADDIVFYSTELCNDKNLLIDCINEVLMDFCENEFNPGPWISFLKPEVQLSSATEMATKVAREEVYWHLLPLPSPHTLDQIVRKDMARCGSWMDLRFEIGCIGSYTVETILDELVEEIIRSYGDENKPL